MYYFLIPIILSLVGIAFYLYFALKRFCVSFKIPVKTKKKKVFLGFLAIGVEALCFVFGFFGIVVLLHFILISIICQIFNFIVKKLFKRSYKYGCRFWKKLYGSSVISVILTAAVLLGGYFNMLNVVKTEYEIKTDKAIRTQGYRVALISDVHYGVSLNKMELEAVCDEISAENPDLVILCGDIVDNETSKEGMREVFSALGGIDSEYGVFYTYGNHDRSMRIVRSQFEDSELINVIEENNIHILKDEIAEINDELVLVGREDASFGANSKRLSVNELLDPVNKEKFILTLDHQPREYKENAKAGTDLLLSGHTHGGQIWPTNYINTFISSNDAVYGKTKLDSDSVAIVSSGLAGWGFPIKTAGKAEYVIIDIKI